MKKNLFYLSVFAALFTTSCSNNDEPNPSGNATGEQYMAVTIKDVNSGSRAVTDGGFEGAVGGEGTITANNLYFLFFDEYGNAFPLAYANVNGTVTTNMVIPTELNASDETNGEEAGTLTGVLVLGKTVGEGYVGTTPSQVLCVANPRTEVMKALENLNLRTVLAKVTFVPEDKWSVDGEFLMTNSTYADATKTNVITAVDVTGKIESTPEAAKKNPAVIYLERLAAKVRATYDASYNVQKREADGTVSAQGTFKLDNEDVTFTARIDGWQLYNTAMQANAFKQLTPSNYAGWGDWWNDSAKHRSYWAESNAGSTLNKNSYNIYDATQFTTQSFIATNNKANLIYCYENTSHPSIKIGDRSKNAATAIVIKATIMKDGEPINMYRWAGTYYTEDRLKERVANAYVASHSGTADKTKVKFKKSTNNDNTWYAVYEQADGTEVDMSATFNNILWWRNGVTSYYANIEHLGKKIGVVRNHIYDYTVDGIVGLGIPGNDPTTPTETESFLACHVRVLNWHLLKNNITLE